MIPVMLILVLMVLLGAFALTYQIYKLTELDLFYCNRSLVQKTYLHMVTF